MFLAPCKAIQNSLVFLIPHQGFRILGNGFRIICQWNLDSVFQALVGSGFFELYFIFQSAGFRILRVKFSGFRNLDSLTCIGRYFRQGGCEL